jgi:hypothetical protein
MVMTIFEFQKMTSTLNPYALKSVLSRARVSITSRPVEACEHCKQIPLTTWKPGRRFCNNACKQKAWRVRRKNLTTGSPRTRAP